MLVDLLRFGVGQAEDLPIGSDIVIAGGGKLALDAARICKEKGAQNITILYREGEDHSPISDSDLTASGLTDLNIVYNAAITRLTGEADQLEQVKYVTTDTSKMAIISAQTLIFATGRFPELVFVRPQPDSAEAGEDESVESLPDESLRWEAAPPYKQPALKDEVGLFAEGDVLADYSAAIKAIGAGRRAAASIHQIMHGLSPSLTEHVITPQSTLQNVYHVEKVAASQRQIMPICSGQELAACGEIERGFSADMAKEEADRCLQCGLICYAHTKPDSTDEVAAPAEASS